MTFCIYAFYVMISIPNICAAIDRSSTYLCTGRYFHGAYTFIFLQVRLAKERKKGDKIVSDSQERAYWRVARPPPGVTSALEPCPVPVRVRHPRPKKRTIQQLQREVSGILYYILCTYNFFQLFISVFSSYFKISIAILYTIQNYRKMCHTFFFIGSTGGVTNCADVTI